MATVTVLDHERAVRFRDGRLAGVVGPGRLRFRRRRTRVVVVDLRLRTLTVAAQEIVAADGVPVKVSVAARWRVTDPVAFLTAAESTAGELYLVLQLALRDLVAERTSDQVLAERSTLADGMAETVATRLSDLGLTVESAAVKDVVLPPELRRAAAAVVLARQEGLAALERARGESAALRSMANVARVLADNPALLALRTLQTADRPGTTVVLTPVDVPVGVPAPR